MYSILHLLPRNLTGGQKVYTMIPYNSRRTNILTCILALFSCHVNLHDLDVLYEPTHGVFLRTRYQTLSVCSSANDSRNIYNQQSKTSSQIYN